ncbi:hypothetical protein SANTM175S_03167 [Streptomyces antimycoticus]
MSDNVTTTKPASEEEVREALYDVVDRRARIAWAHHPTVARPRRTAG